jgi:hypothetical protein
MNKAWEGAIDGMNRAADHAERKEEGWKNRAFAFFCEFANQAAGEFMVCDVIYAAEDHANLATPDPRAWGHVAHRARKKGFVRQCGYSNRTSGKAHASPRAMWMWTGKENI